MVRSWFNPCGQSKQPAVVSLQLLKCEVLPVVGCDVLDNRKHTAADVLNSNQLGSFAVLLFVLCHFSLYFG